MSDDDMHARLILLLAALSGGCGRVASDGSESGVGGVGQGGSSGFPGLSPGGREPSTALETCEAAPVLDRQLISTPLDGAAFLPLAGDVDGDARTDFVFVGKENRVVVLLGNGDGSFAPPLLGVPLEGSPFSLASADVDADGKLDLVATFTSRNTLSVLLGQGDGSFAQLRVEVGTHAQKAVFGDWNHDGHLDIATAHDRGLDGSEVDVLLGQGDGSFRQPLAYSLDRATSLEAADFDRDRNLDLLVAAPLPTILFGDGDGSFSSRQSFPLEHETTLVEALDYDYDGDLDIAACDAGGRSLGGSILQGHGDRTFSPPERDARWSGCLAARRVDLNGDGIEDLIRDAVYLGQPDGTRKLISELADLEVLADWNADGWYDLGVTSLIGFLVGDRWLHVLTGNGDGTFGSAQHYPGDPSYILMLSDVNRDGRADMLVSNFGSEKLDVRLANEAGSFDAADEYTLSPALVGMMTGDLDGDEFPDVVTIHLGEQPVVNVLMADGEGHYTRLDESTITEAGGVVLGAALGDVNGDGYADLMTNTRLSGTALAVSLGTGDGSFAPSHESVYESSRLLGRIELVDLNADEHLDVLGITSSSVVVLHGTGTGTFSLVNSQSIGGGARWFRSGDSNGDNHLDLAILREFMPTVELLLGHGDGTFSEGVTYSLPVFPSDVAFGDVNNDQQTDLVVPGGGGFAVLLGDGHSGPACARRYPLPALSVQLDDVNRDGHLDVLAGHRDGVRVFLNWQE